MRLIRLLNISCFCAAGVLGLALSIVIAPRIIRKTEASLAPRQLLARGHWAHHYDQLSQMQADVDVIVIATHLQSMPGRVVGAGIDALSFTNQHFTVNQILRGQLSENFVVEQTGGLPAQAQRFSIDDGGAYDRGGRYLLFLNKQPDTAMYYLVNPQGRFHNEGGKLKAVVRDPVTNQIHGLTEQEAMALLRN